MKYFGNDEKSQSFAMPGSNISFEELSSTSREKQTPTMNH